MKDADARERLNALEQALRDLPSQVTEVVVAHFAPTMANVNKVLDAMGAQSTRVDAALAALAAPGELLEVVESELNALRVDVNAQREATAAVAEQLAAMAETFGNVSKAFGAVAAKT